MMLAVAYNPTYPTIIDVEGLNIDFSVSNTGISGGKINITGIGSLVDVWMGTGSMSTIAYIQWLQSYISRNNMCSSFLTDPNDPLIYTLNTIITGSSMTGEAIDYGGPSRCVAIMESVSSLYYGEYYGAAPGVLVSCIYRKGLGGNSGLDASILCSGTAMGGHFSSVEDGKLFGLAYDGTYLNGSKLYLNLYDFNNSTITTIHTGTAWAANESWTSQTVVGNPGSEKLVALSSYKITGSSFGGHIQVFDAHSKSYLREDAIIFSDPQWDTNVLYSHLSRFIFCQKPQIYNDLVVYSFEEEYKRYPNSPPTPPDYYHYSGVIVYDPSSGSYGFSSVEHGRQFGQPVGMIIGGIDYETGYYYFIEYDTTDITRYRVYKSTISLSPSITLVATLSDGDYLSFVMGKLNLYGVHGTTGNIVKLSDLSVVGSVSIGTSTFAPHLDETDKRVWYVNSATGSVLTGASVIGEEDKIITLSNGIFVSNPIDTMNLVNKGVVFTTSTQIGLVQG